MSRRERPLRVLLVDDQTLFRKGMEIVLKEWPDVQVVGEAVDGLEAVHKARELRPDVVLMDVHMPVMDGLEATRLILDESPEAKVIMLTVSEGDDSLFQAINIGARGYLLKDLNPAVLHEMLFAAVRGETPISPLMTGRILEEYARRVPQMLAPRQIRELSAREKQILELAAAGENNMAIAESLFLTYGTVKSHMHNILRKLGASSRVEAIAYAVHRGIIPPNSPRE